MAACLVANPPARVQIDGYANGTGASDASQRAVSEQRAMTVRDRMVQQDVTTDRITTVGMGAADSNGAESRPVEKVVL